ncbi:MAG: FAD:protein FMN transferase [Verrucomicrobiota bacterium]
MFPSTLSNIYRRPAMNTLFEIIVGGEDLENDSAAAEAALDEISRVETVLSRFDPASEVARVNREAHWHPVLISYELLEILELCRSHWEKTSGYFDITANGASHDEKINFQNVMVDSATRRISFSGPNVKLDFGAFGKGYALDCAAQMLKEFGVQNVLLHGGTSSVLAIGTAAQVGLRNPWAESEELENVLLYNQGLSSSATFHRGQTTSDIIDPHQCISLHENAACVVIGTTASEAEIFSTALLSMGKERAEKYCVENLPPNFRVLWIDKDEVHGSAGLQPLSSVDVQPLYKFCRVNPCPQLPTGPTAPSASAS